MTFEKTIADSSAVFEPTVKAAKKGAAAVVSAAKMLDGGQIRAISRRLDEAQEELSKALEGLRAFQSSWEEYGLNEYFGSEGYVAELTASLQELGVDFHPLDDVFYVYPSLLRLDPAATTARIDKKAEPRLRPAKLAQLLRDLQNRPSRFPVKRFLSALFKVYKALASRNLKRSEDWTGRPIFLRDIYDMLASAPDTDYSIREFVRDVYLLDASGEPLEVSGYIATLEASSATRDTAKTLSIITRDGQRRLYCAIRFDHIAR